MQCATTASFVRLESFLTITTFTASPVFLSMIENLPKRLEAWHEFHVLA